MKILVSKLPSGGFASTLDIIDLQPLNYGELMKYSSEKSSDPLSDLLWDMENLICTIRGWEELSSFDTHVLIAYRKMLTLSLSGSITLLNGEKFDLSDIEFSDLDRELICSIEEIKLGNKKCKPSVLSMGKFYKYLVGCKNDGIENDKLAIIGSYLGISPKEVLSLTNDDIVICEGLYHKIISHPMVKMEGGREVILVGKASQLFHSLLELSKPDPSKILYSKVSTH